MQLRRRTRALLAAGLLAITTGTLLGVTGIAVAGAESLPSIPNISSTTLPAGCSGGASLLEGVRFSNGRQSSGDLSFLTPLRGEDTLTMSWTGVADACAADDGQGTREQPAVPVTLAVYGGVDYSDVYDFKPEDTQTLLYSNSCGGAAGECDSTYTEATGTRTYFLTLELPDADEACYAQADAVLGAALATVGLPNNFYKADTRQDKSGPDLLISAGSVDNSDEEGNCPTTTTTEPPTTTTTEAPTTTTTAPVVPPTTEAPTTTAPVEVRPVVAVAGVTVSRQLPETGAHTGVLVLLGTSLIVLGGAALLAVRAQARGLTAS